MVADFIYLFLKKFCFLQVLVRIFSLHIQKQRDVVLKWDMAAGIEQSRNPVCHRGSEAPRGTAALG